MAITRYSGDRLIGLSVAGGDDKPVLANNAVEKGTNILPHQVTSSGSSQTSTYGYAIGGGEHQTDVTEYEFGTTTASNTDKGTLVTSANNWNAGGAGSP